MNWYKFRTLRSYGPSVWHYVEQEPDEIHDYLQSIADEYNYSDKWRGIEWYKIVAPPRRVLDAKIKFSYNTIRETDQTIKLARDKIARYSSLYKHAPV